MLYVSTIRQYKPTGPLVPHSYQCTAFLSQFNIQVSTRITQQTHSKSH